MRRRARTTLLAAAAALSAACSGKDPSSPPAACEVPAGCVRAERVDGSCRCLEWQVVSIEPVPVRLVVVAILYPPPGNGSGVTAGHFPWGDPPLVASASDLGARWRSVVRAWDGSESVAALGPGGWTEDGIWPPLVPVTGTTAAGASHGTGGNGLYGDVDVPSAAEHLFFVWINPAAAVLTNAAGERSISWSWRSDCIDEYPCYGTRVVQLRGGWLDGTVPLPVPPDSDRARMFARLDDADRATILSYDPFYDPPGRDPATIASDPRFLRVGTATISSGPGAEYPVAWTPCEGTLTDDAFAPLHSTEVPFGGFETLVLQHGVLSTSAACAEQRPGLYLATATPGCTIEADVLVDTLFGTPLLVPASATRSCTTR